MTPDELRALAEEATQEGIERIPALHKLKKMAPQLALLCAEMGEALNEVFRIDSGEPMLTYPEDRGLEDRRKRTIVRALRSLEALEKPLPPARDPGRPSSGPY